MPGSWEFSNADREKTCTITFRNDAARVGKRVEFDPGCVKLFPFIPEIAGWRLNDNDFLRLLDAQGNSVLEFSEVESGIFEAPKPGEGILFIQNPTDLGPAPKTAEQITGDWTIIRRTGQRVCGLTLSNTAAGEEFVVRVQQPCDRAVTRVRAGDLADGSRRDRAAVGQWPVLALRGGRGREMAAASADRQPNFHGPEIAC